MITLWPAAFDPADPAAADVFRDDPHDVARAHIGAPDVCEAPTAADIGSAELVARAALDNRPDLANEALDRVFGPYADLVDLRRPEHRRAATIAVAWLADRPEVSEPSAFEQWAQSKRAPSPVERARLRVVVRAATGVFRRESDGTWTDVLGALFGARRHPTRLVAPFGAVVDGLAEPRWLIARGALCADGVVVALPLAIPDAPEALLRSWLAEQEITTPGSWADARLAARGYDLARRLHELAWLRESA